MLTCGVSDPTVNLIVSKNKGLKKETDTLDKKDMIGMNEFAKEMERQYGKGLWRAIHVEVSPNGQKRPMGEKNNMTREAILKERKDPRYKSGGSNTFSFSLKHTDSLYCIDFDTKDFKTTEFFDTLVDTGTYHTETTKGWHFYINIENFPPYSNEKGIANLDYFHTLKDIDLIKHANNMWEPFTREMNGGQFATFQWEDISKYLDSAKMNFHDQQEVVEVPPVPYVDSEDDFEFVNEEVLAAPLFKKYLNRLNESRYGYDDWLSVGMICHSNFKGEDEGLEIWREWSLKDPNVQGRMTYPQQFRKYSSFAHHPGNPKTWKTLRMWADKDSPENPYQTIWDIGGDDAITEELNKTLSYNIKTSEYIIMLADDDWEAKNDRQIKQHYQTYDFLVPYENAKGETEYKKANPYAIWVKSIRQKKIDRVVFDPRNNSPMCFNLWKGYPLGEMSAVESYDESECQPIIDHIHKLWCRGNQKHTDYVLNWLAMKLQKPWKKVAVVIVLKSKEGSGKNIILNKFKGIMGQYYISLSNANLLLGDFNGSLEGKMLINADEIAYGGNKKEMNQLKALITEDETVINKKNKECYKINNYADYIFTTNELWFIGVTSSSRRYFVLDMDDWLGSQPESVKGPIIQTLLDVPEEAFAKYLLNRNIENFNPRDFERTHLFQRQVQLNWTSEVKYIHKIMETGIITGPHPKVMWDPRDDTNEGLNAIDTLGIQVIDKITHEESYWFKMEEIYLCYINANLGGYATRVPQQSFFSTLYEIFPSIKEKKFKNSKVIQLPTLEEARLNFNAYQGYKFDYGDDLDAFVDCDEYEVCEAD